MRNWLFISFLTAFIVGCNSGPPQPLPKKENVEESDGFASEEDEDDDIELDDDGDDDSKSENSGGKTVSDVVSAEDDEDLEEDGEDFGALLAPSKLQGCHGEGKLFDRKAQLDSEGETVVEQCHTATYPATFGCDRAGIEAAFGNSTQIVERLDTLLDVCGYRIDQCGNRGSLPFVFLTMVGRGDKGAECGHAGETCGSEDSPALCYYQLAGREK